MANVEIRGMGRLKRNLRAIGAAGPRVVAKGLYEMGERIMADSKENYVPVDFGTLRASGHVEPPKTLDKDVSVTLGFGGPAAPYAAAVHENPRAGKTGGTSPQGRPYKHYSRVGEWKYLETPFKKHVHETPKVIAKYLDAEIRRRAAR